MLGDIRDAFAGLDEESVSSKRLVEKLVQAEDRPWGECNHGKPLTHNQLARRLKPFGIFPKMVGPKAKRVSGYPIGSFADALARYLRQSPSSRSLREDQRNISRHGFSDENPAQTSHHHTFNAINHLDEIQTSHQEIACEVGNHANQLNSHRVWGCEVEKPGNGETREHETKSHANASVAGLPNGDVAGPGRDLGEDHEEWAEWGLDWGLTQSR